MTTANAYPAAQTIRTIGILGGGQLGMMLAAAALPLGYRCVFFRRRPKLSCLFVWSGIYQRAA